MSKFETEVLEMQQQLEVYSKDIVGQSITNIAKKVLEKVPHLPSIFETIWFIKSGGIAITYPEFSDFDIEAQLEIVDYERFLQISTQISEFLSISNTRDNAFRYSVYITLHNLYSEDIAKEMFGNFIKNIDNSNKTVKNRKDSENKLKFSPDFYFEFEKSDIINVLESIEVCDKFKYDTSEIIDKIEKKKNEQFIAFMERNIILKRLDVSNGEKLEFCKNLFLNGYNGKILDEDTIINMLYFYDESLPINRLFNFVRGIGKADILHHFNTTQTKENVCSAIKNENITDDELSSLSLYLTLMNSNDNVLEYLLSLIRSGMINGEVLLFIAENYDKIEKINEDEAHIINEKLSEIILKSKVEKEENFYLSAIMFLKEYPTSLEYFKYVTDEEMMKIAEVIGKLNNILKIEKSIKKNNSKLKTLGIEKIFKFLCLNPESLENTYDINEFILKLDENTLEEKINSFEKNKEAVVDDIEDIQVPINKEENNVEEILAELILEDLFTSDLQNKVDEDITEQNLIESTDNDEINEFKILESSDELKNGEIPYENEFIEQLHFNPDDNESKNEIETDTINFSQNKNSTEEPEKEETENILVSLNQEEIENEEKTKENLRNEYDSDKNDININDDKKESNIGIKNIENSNKMISLDVIKEEEINKENSESFTEQDDDFYENYGEIISNDIEDNERKFELISSEEITINKGSDSLINLENEEININYDSKNVINQKKNESLKKNSQKNDVTKEMADGNDKIKNEKENINDKTLKRSETQSKKQRKIKKSPTPIEIKTRNKEQYRELNRELNLEQQEKMSKASNENNKANSEKLNEKIKEFCDFLDCASYFGIKGIEKIKNNAEKCSKGDIKIEVMIKNIEKVIKKDEIAKKNDETKVKFLPRIILEFLIAFKKFFNYFNSNDDREKNIELLENVKSINSSENLFKKIDDILKETNEIKEETKSDTCDNEIERNRQL